MATVPAVFRWHGKGEDVALGLAVNEYRAPIPMSRSGQDFSTIVEVPSGLHFYRFLVDGTWKSADDQPFEVAPDGEVANILDANVSETMSDGSIPAAYLLAATSPPGDYTHFPPDDVELVFERTGSPPFVPAHLNIAILNNPTLTDDEILPIPQHVALNHVYSGARRDNLLMFGATHRYRAKFVTTVYYTERLSMSSVLPLQPPISLSNPSSRS